MALASDFQRFVQIGGIGGLMAGPFPQQVKLLAAP
jgi:hypothetical protein